MATGLKRVLPDHVVFTYQGDGDLASIGGNEILHAAARGENITVVFVNNGVYGMTGGQMAPTTLIGGVTTSSPGGRSPALHGYPLHMPEMLATLPGGSLCGAPLHAFAGGDPAHQKGDPPGIRRQLQGRGLSIVEMLSTCPTNWRLTPSDALAIFVTTCCPSIRWEISRRRQI